MLLEDMHKSIKGITDVLFLKDVLRQNWTEKGIHICVVFLFKNPLYIDVNREDPGQWSKTFCTYNFLIVCVFQQQRSYKELISLGRKAIILKKQFYIVIYSFYIIALKLSRIIDAVDFENTK